MPQDITRLPSCHLRSINYLCLVIPSDRIPEVHCIPPLPTLTLLIVAGDGISMKNLGQILCRTPNLKLSNIYDKYFSDDLNVYDGK